MFYHIVGWETNREGRMSGAGFMVKLFPPVRDAVAARALTQANVNQAIISCGRHWLDSHGYDAPFEYDGKVRPDYTLAETAAGIRHMRECSSCKKMIADGSDRARATINPANEAAIVRAAYRESVRLSEAMKHDPELSVVPRSSK